MVVSLEMVLPGLAGYWLDKRLGTVVLFIVVGLALGGVGGMYHLLRMTKSDAEERSERDKRLGGK